jgi:microcompartment protein CcmL/EutN
VKLSLGLLEVSGFALAVNTADAMAKSASVKLVGIDTCKGGGWMTIKITGDVAAVDAALSTGAAFAVKHGGLIAKSLLARPDTQLMQQVVPSKTKVEKPSPTPEPAEAQPIVQEEVAETTAGEMTPDQEGEPTLDFPDGKVTCNLCQDPLCPRQKGEPRNKCLHARGHA